MASPNPKILRQFARVWKTSACPVLAENGIEQLDDLERATRLAITGVMKDAPASRDTAAIFRPALEGSILMIALHKALRARGMATEESGKLCLTIMERHIAATPSILKWLQRRGLFTKLAISRTRRAATQMESQPDNQFKFDVVTSDDGSGNWGFNLTNCAICSLTRAQGVEDFTRYLCDADRIMSDQFGWGLKRTQTIAKGGSHCDFRFRKGEQTEMET